MRFLEIFRNRPSNFSCILGTPKGVQNAPEHHHNTSISISNLQKHVPGPTRTGRPGGLHPPSHTGLQRPPGAGNPRGGPQGVGQTAGDPWGGRFIPDSSTPCVRAPLCPKRTHSRGRAPPSLCGRGREPDPPLCQMFGDPLGPKRPKGRALAG